MRNSSLAWGSLILASVVISATALAFSQRSQNNDVRRNRELIACITRWSTRTTERANVLSGATLARSNALDALIRTLVQHPHNMVAERRAFERALANYIAASNRYARDAKLFPVPRSPQFTCRAP